MYKQFYLILISVTIYSCTSVHKNEQAKQSLDSIKQFVGIKLREVDEPEVIQETPSYSMGYYEVEEYVAVFTDSSVLRSDTSFVADTVVVLKQNTKLKILGQTCMDSLNGLHGYWQKVEFEGKEGYIWGPELALVQMDLPSEDITYSMLYGITGVNKDFTHTAEVYLLKADSLIQRLKIRPIEMTEGINTIYQYDVRGVLWKNTGFTGVKNLIGLEGGVGACGYDYGHIIMLWDGKKLYQGPTVVGMGDADVAYKVPYVYYPKDSIGLKDKMVVKVLYGEAYEEKEGYKEEVETTVYSWKPGKGLEKE